MTGWGFKEGQGASGARSIGCWLLEMELRTPWPVLAVLTSAFCDAVQG